MQIVIEIPEEYYEQMKNTPVWWSGMKNCIINGKPLPKGHGRLIDADVLADGFEDNYEFCEVVNATPTIIEADTESEDKE